jgi:uncharacterized protein YegP (UPF0339 family)
MTTLTRRSALAAFAAAAGLRIPSASFGFDDPSPDQRPALRFELYRDSRRLFRWRLKAANGRILGTSSEGYTAKSDCRTAIDRIREGASTAALDDLSS